jgi:hypothetical protein
VAELRAELDDKEREITALNADLDSLQAYADNVSAQCVLALSVR